jgi:hypothetical protein
MYDPEPERFSFSYHSIRSTNNLQDEDNGHATWRAGTTNGFEEEAGLSGSVVRRTLSRTKSREANDWTGRGVQSDELGIPWGEAEDMEFEALGSDGIPEEVDNLYHERDEIDNLTNKSDPRQDRTSTITPSEKLAFQKIFSDIFARSRPAKSYGIDGLLDKQETDEASDETERRRDRTRENLDKIVHAAIKGRPRAEIEVAVNRYPPALRAAAARAMGLPSKKDTLIEATEEAEAANVKVAADLEEARAADEPTIDDDRLERLRKPERDRVEGLMRSAATDFELWAVMEMEVFPLITKLGLVEAPEDQTPAKKKRGKKPNLDPQDPTQTNPEQMSVRLDSPVDEISPLEFYGPLYPSYLLLGLRLLDRSFSKPSPLTLNILPEIKSLGIISHVLGGSTQLYNELLLIHWHRYDDFRGVLNLLKEMEQFGLDWDKETWNIINDITEMQNFVRRGDRGEALKSLWTLPEFAPGRFKTWKRKIGQALNETSQNFPLSSY